MIEIAYYLNNKVFKNRTREYYPRVNEHVNFENKEYMVRRIIHDEYSGTGIKIHLEPKVEIKHSLSNLFYLL